MKYKDGFKCDNEIKKICKDLIENNWFSSCTINYDEANDNNQYAPIDIVFTAVTKSNKQHIYAIELKERKGYNSTDFNSDWIIEQDKLNKLYDYISSGYTSCYFNIFKDNVYMLWVINDVKKYLKPIVINAPKYTQGDEHKLINKNVYTINQQYAKIKGKINN